MPGDVVEEKLMSYDDSSCNCEVGIRCWTVGGGGGDQAQGVSLPGGCRDSFVP